MDKANTKIRYLSTIIIIGVIVIYSVFFARNLYKQNSLDTYTGSIADIQLKNNRQLFKLKLGSQNFYVIPEAAKKLGPKYKKASVVTKETAENLELISPPKEYSVKHRNLVKSYSLASNLYSDLYKVSDHIIKRDKIIKSLIKELKIFAKTISKSKKEEQALKVAKEAEVQIRKILKDLQGLRTPIAVFDDKLLIKYSKELAQHLKQFQSELRREDTDGIQETLYQIQLDYSDDWQAAFYKADKRSIKKYDNRVKQIEALSE